MMKHVLTILSTFLSTMAICQITDSVYVAFDETTVLIFDAKVKRFDIGNQDYAIGWKTENTLKIKANKEDFSGTNVFVVTNNGYYEFKVYYKEYLDEPVKKYTYKESLFYDKNEQSGTQKQQVNKSENIDIGELSDIVLNKKQNVNAGITNAQGIIFFLSGIYIKNGHLFFKINIRNTSNVTYDIDLLNFSVRNKKGKVKKSAVQEISKKPLFVKNDTIKQIPPGIEIKRVYVFSKFTISEKKRLFIEIWEDEGDRIEQFGIKPKMIAQAEVLK